MQKCHISRHDLDEADAEGGVDQLSKVERGCKERNGEITLFAIGRLPDRRHPVRAGVQTVRVELGS